jgi:hypothetical protein
MATEEQAHELYSKLFETATKHFPETPLVQRTDFVMDVYQVFHVWATGGTDEVNGATRTEQEGYVETTHSQD